MLCSEILMTALAAQRRHGTGRLRTRAAGEFGSRQAKTQIDYAPFYKCQHTRMLSMFSIMLSVEC